MDEWYGLTIDDARRLEKEAFARINKVSCSPRVMLWATYVVMPWPRHWGVLGMPFS